MMWPFRKTPREEWWVTGEERWATVETAGDYARQRLERKIVRFPDGEIKWVPVPSNPYLPRRIGQIVMIGAAA